MIVSRSATQWCTILLGLQVWGTERADKLVATVVRFAGNDREPAHLLNDCVSLKDVGLIFNEPTGLFVWKSSLEPQVRARPQRGTCNAHKLLSSTKKALYATRQTAAKHPLRMHA